VTEPEAQPAVSTEVVINEVAAEEKPVQVVEPVAQPVVHAAAPVPVPAAPAAPVTRVEDLNDMLKSAGLVLAATDPDKVRQAQTYATPVAEVRAPRVRKPAVEIPSEPLQLVQTKQPPQ